jgi:hypothetical protein
MHCYEADNLSVVFLRFGPRDAATRVNFSVSFRKNEERIMKAGERRFTPRYSLKIPLTIQTLGPAQAAAQSTETANISVRGIYFASECRFEVGTPVQIALRMPEEVLGRVSQQWNCRGRVVRVEADLDCRTLIGVEIQYYELSR